MFEKLTCKLMKLTSGHMYAHERNRYDDERRALRASYVYVTSEDTDSCKKGLRYP
jgi:hypothetical protein